MPSPTPHAGTYYVKNFCAAIDDEIDIFHTYVHVPGGEGEAGILQCRAHFNSLPTRTVSNKHKLSTFTNWGIKEVL